MKQALLLTAALCAAFLVVEFAAGLDFAVALGFGATIVVVATNALTFLWLWWVRATPLALGMALSWLSQAALSVWWYTSGSVDVAAWVRNIDGLALFAMLSIYIVGGSLHIAVMRRSMDLSRTAMILPVLGAVAVAVTAQSLL